MPVVDDAARCVLEALCSAPGESGLEQVAERVARAVAAAEPAGERARREQRFAALIASGRFLPSVPILANAGRSGQLAACFVIEPEDSLDSIYAELGTSARIQQGSGGVGIHFSRLRPAGSPIRRSGGVSPGVVAFVRLFAHSARVNRLSGRRPGAHLAVLAVGHPDAPDFVAAAGDERLAGMGLALGLTDAFLAAAARGDRFRLEHARGAGRQLDASELLERVCERIVATGQPSLLFLDTIEAANPTPWLGAIHATNPCGEQPLLPGESCVLGSLCLPAFADARGRLDRRALAGAIAEAVRFLDDVVQVSRFPTPEIERATLRTRKVGLGFMGLADLALLRGLEYGSPECHALVDELARQFATGARTATEALAAERGPCPAHDGVGPARRNAAVLAIAPTGTLRLIAGCSGGLEPFIHPVRRVEHDRGSALWVDRWLLDWLRKRSADEAELLRALEDGVAASALPGLDEGERRLLRRGAEIEPMQQVHVQAVAQAHVDGAVSKTVHLPADVTPAQVRALVLSAHRTGCKGIALYRVDAPAAPCALRSCDLTLDLA